MRFRRHQEAAEQSTRQLLVLFVVVVVGLLVAVNAVLALIFWISVPFARALPAYFFETNSALVLLFVLGGCWVESQRLSKGGPHVAELAGARTAQPGGRDELSRREQRFVNVVQEMALASGQRPTPQAWVLPRDDAINALAAGWGSNDAVVVVTRGALERLTRAELQGVVAHEFSHIVHGDTRLNMRLVGLVWGLQMIWGLGVSLWSADEQGRRGAGALFGLGLMAVGSLGWLAGRLLQAAVSRQREFLADASAVKFARHVDGLGGALRKIADQQSQRVRGLASAHASSLAHLLLSGDKAARGGWRRWLATHPPLSERLSRLYGRSFESDELLLRADRVALDATEDAATAFAPLQPAQGAGPPGAAGPAASPGDGAGGASPSEGARHDVLQKPAHFDGAERARDALRRIALWHGPGEWQAAMLALAIESDATHSAPAWRAYEAATADLHVSQTVRAQIAALSPAQRRDVFAQLLARVRQWPAAQQRQLWRAWSRRSRPGAWADAADAAWRWRAIVIRHAFAPPRAPDARGTLASHAAAVRAATRAMARVISRDETTRGAWQRAAQAELESMGLPPQRGPAIGLAPLTVPIGEHAGLLALRVRQLAPMQRPLLLRAWVQAAQTCALLTEPRAADALHQACLCLDLPVPDVLLR
jgi:Zn-dependent protease with chaperone function